MTKEDAELLAGLKEMEKEILDAAIRFREEAPGLSYLQRTYAKKTKKAEDRLTPVKKEWEGGGGSWFALCEECRGQVGQSDLYCRHCGRALNDEE